MDKKQTTETGINTRYPNDLLEEMRKLAKQHDRSFNGEVIWALRSYVAQHMEFGPMIKEVTISSDKPMTVIIHPRINIDFYHPEHGSIPVVFAYPKDAVAHDFRLSRIQLWDGSWKCISLMKSTTPPVRSWLPIHNTASLSLPDAINFRNWIQLQSEQPLYFGHAYLFATAGLEEQKDLFSQLVRDVINIFSGPSSFVGVS